ncbi:MAG: CHASE2 domain-containing protein [Leptolyngbyaceae cyanobacterium RU_5_1]|nr:CHASE2 domain-containing protein [Leptolyngbyaceae cyanobacterium RU_5_1]
MLLGKRQLKSWPRLNRVVRGKRRVLFTSLSVAGCIIALRVAGFLQTWELTTLDQFFQFRPLEPVDHRIVIISIDEADLHKVGKYPIPDAQMAELLQKLHDAQPRAIGLDVYRDLPVEPGHTKLLQISQQIPNLVSIEHIQDEGELTVPPLSLLSQRNQAGFNNVVHDQDDKVRRGLLYWQPRDSSKARQSFALMLALKYLQADGITPRASADHTGEMQLGNAVFRRFRSDTGGYARADEGGYQILMNPRGPADSFHRVSMMDVLEKRVSPELLRDRIVLIGYTAVSLNDFVTTSYSSRMTGASQPIPGIELHANLISQIIGAALDGRMLIQTWSEPLEWVWILVWSGVGAGMSWKLRSPRIFALLLILIGTSLTGVCYLTLLKGWWIPVIPPMLAFLGSAIAITVYVARLQEELRRSKEFLNTIINTIPDPIFVKDQDHRWIVLNEAYARFLGHSLKELLQRSDYDVFPKHEADVFRQQDELVFNTGQEYQNEELFTNRNGITYQIETKRSLHKDAAGNLFLVGIIRDITQHKRLEAELKHTAAELVRSNAELQRSANQLSHIANHDSLTGLPNRKLFYERLEQELSWADENPRLVALLFLDLDGFKQINDSMGHDMGDLVLKSLADRLTGCLRGSDTVARLGGDEFIVILPAIPSAQDAAIVAEKLLTTVFQESSIAGHTVSITGSIGISLYPDHAQTAEMLIKNADTAMYRAKQQGKNCYEFSTAQESRLENAIDVGNSC